MGIETLAVIVTVLSSAVATSAWVTTRLAKLEVEIKHAFLRIAALETKAAEVVPTPRTRQRKR